MPKSLARMVWVVARPHLTARDNSPDEGIVLGTCPSHALVEAFSKVGRRVPCGSHCEETPKQFNGWIFLKDVDG